MKCYCKRKISVCMAMHGSMQLKYVLTKVQQHWDYECEEHRVCRFQGCACYGFYTIWWWHGPNFSHEPARGHPLLCWLSSSTWRWHGREAIGGLCSQPSNLCPEDQPFPKVDLPCSVFSHVLLVITPRWGTRRAPEFVWGTRLDWRTLNMDQRKRLNLPRPG